MQSINLEFEKQVVSEPAGLFLKEFDLIFGAFQGQKGCAGLFIRLNKGRLVYDHAADL